VTKNPEKPALWLGRRGSFILLGCLLRGPDPQSKWLPKDAEALSHLGTGGTSGL